MNIHKVFKPARKGDIATAAYLYADGHVTVTFERTELGTRLRYLKIAESIGVRPGFRHGRIVFHNTAPLLAASLFGAHIAVYEDNTTETSPARKLGVRFSDIYIETHGHGSIRLSDSSIHGGGFTLQTTEAKAAEFSETFAEVARLDRMGDTPILGVYPNASEDS
jgi:prepilin-type processing-associated H-X9-DG protein